MAVEQNNLNNNKMQQLIIEIQNGQEQKYMVIHEEKRVKVDARGM
jgi:inorganic pyrophosphatase